MFNGLNGVGRLFVQAVQNQDYTLTQALVMLTVAVFVFTNLAVDLLYAWLDPRISASTDRTWECMSHDRRRTPDAIDLRPSAPQEYRALRFCTRQPLGTFGLVLVVIIAITGIFAEVLAPYVIRRRTTSRR